MAAQVLQLHGEPAKLAQPGNRRRRGGEHHCTGDAKQHGPDAINDGGGGMGIAGPLGKVFHVDENQSPVGRAANETESADGKGAFDLRHLL